jgi:hypothetical protein
MTDLAIMISSSVRMIRKATRLPSDEIKHAFFALRPSFNSKEAELIADSPTDERRVIADTSLRRRWCPVHREPRQPAAQCD